jgi:hypothetical protein
MSRARGSSASRRSPKPALVFRRKVGADVVDELLRRFVVLVKTGLHLDAGSPFGTGPEATPAAPRTGPWTGQHPAAGGLDRSGSLRADLTSVSTCWPIPSGKHCSKSSTMQARTAYPLASRASRSG